MKYVIGVDSGGSKTRALAVEFDGTPVGYAETGGGNPFHNPDFKNALGSAILAAARLVGISNVVCVVSGIAGLDRPSDYEWAREATAVEGLCADQLHVNDAEVAHFGAFSGSHGVVSIQGHGSNIFAVTEDGAKVLNSNFMHYASSGAVALSMKFHFALMWSGGQSGDEDLVRRLCVHWNVESLDALHALGRRGWDLDSDKARNHMAAFAHEITSAAAKGSETALTACRQAAYSVAEGIGLVGQCFEGTLVPVVLSGSTVQSGVMKSLVAGFLDQSESKRYTIQEPDHSPLVGAVMMALQWKGVDLGVIDKKKLGSSFGIG